MDNDTNTPFYTRNQYGLLVTHRYFREVVPSTGTDLGVLMVHQGSEYDESDSTVTLQPKKARIARITRLVRDATGAVRPAPRSARLKPGSLVKFGQEPHRFDLANLEPVGNPLKTPLPIIDASAYAEAKALHGLERKMKAMERFENARTGAEKVESTETVADVATDLGNGFWACMSPEGGLMLVDEQARIEPRVFETREQLEAAVLELQD